MKKTVENCKIMLLSNIGDGKIECLKKLKNNPRRLAYIPSRSDFGQSYFQRVIDTYSEIVEEFIYCDLESNDYDGLFSADVIFIAGGDECFILKNLLSKGLASKIVDFLNEGNVLIGLCAGAQVISKDIIFVEPSKREKKLEALGYGLGIIDYIVFPRYDESIDRDTLVTYYPDENIILIGIDGVVLIDGKRVALCENAEIL